MINSLKNNETITVNLFGQEKDVKVFCTGDNQFDANGNYKDYDFELTQEEIDLLNWFLDNVKIENYKQQILDYCNNEYSNWEYSDRTQKGLISLDEVENEINIKAIAINVKNNAKYDVSSYPEISFYGDCKCDEENGICIGFRNKEYLGISSQDWTL